MPKDPKDPKWKIYEKAAADIERQYPNCTVTHDHKVMGRRSGIERQVDIWLSGQVGQHDVTVAIECRCYQAPVGIKDIDAFCGFLDDVGANKGVLISDSGFTDGAIKRAAAADIKLTTMTLREAEDIDWKAVVDEEWEEEHRRFYTCKSGFCGGNIGWEKETMYGSAGYCGSCGQFHIRCNRCNSVHPYDLSTQDKHQFHCVRCVGRSGRGRCRMEWRLYFERGLIESMKQSS
jgi:hypothetical protein